MNIGYVKNEIVHLQNCSLEYLEVLLLVVESFGVQLDLYKINLQSISPTIFTEA